MIWYCATRSTLRCVDADSELFIPQCITRKTGDVGFRSLHLSVCCSMTLAEGTNQFDFVLL